MRGGKGANQAVACARLGAETWMLGRVGQDAFGDSLLEGLKENDVNVSCLRRDPEAPSGVAMIIIDAEGDNSIVVAPGANMRGVPADLDAVPDLGAACTPNRGAQRTLRDRSAAGPPALVRPRRLGSFDAVLMQLEVPLPLIAATVKAASQAGVRTILDAGPPRQLPPDLLKQVDVISPNQTEAAAILGSDLSRAEPHHVAQALLDAGANTVVLKLGSKGAFAATENLVSHVKAFKVAPVDTTGAGDAFTAGLAVSLSRGMSLVQSTRVGCACGALAATVLGAQPSMPTWEAVRDFLVAYGAAE